MNRKYYVLLVLLVALLCASSRTAMIGPPGGLLFANLKGPVALTSNINESGYNSYGEATAWSFLYLFAIGDASIDKAKRNGSENPELVRVTHVDYEWIHVLGIGRYRLRVY